MAHVASPDTASRRAYVTPRDVSSTDAMENTRRKNDALRTSATQVSKEMLKDLLKDGEECNPALRCRAGTAEAVGGATLRWTCWSRTQPRSPPTLNAHL